MPTERDRHAELGPTEPDLDAFELALARAADERGVPLLGICRGAQALNVARGGTLHQHVPAAPADRAGRDRDDAHASTSTTARALAAARRRPAAARELLPPPGRRRLGSGLRAVARAADGTIEAVEGPGPRFVLGVQWHAEGADRRAPPPRAVRGARGRRRHARRAARRLARIRESPDASDPARSGPCEPCRSCFPAPHPRSRASPAPSSAPTTTATTPRAGQQRDVDRRPALIARLRLGPGRRRGARLRAHRGPRGRGAGRRHAAPGFSAPPKAASSSTSRR